MYPAIHKPHIPYMGAIPGGVSVGTQVVIEGHVPSWFTDRFDVNLVSGHNPSHDHIRRADIAFHFNPRFEDHTIIINTRTNRTWGPEHREYGDMPIKKGYDFELQITVEDSYFRVTINGQHFTNFPHRLPYRDCGILWIDGRVDIKKIEYMQLGGAGHGGGMPPTSGYRPGPVFPAQGFPSAPTFMPPMSMAAPVFPASGMAYPPAPGGMGYPAAPNFPPGGMGYPAAPNFPPGGMGYPAAPDFPPGGMGYPAAPNCPPDSMAYPPAPSHPPHHRRHY